MEKDNINTLEYWNQTYSKEFYQDNSVADWDLFHTFIEEVLPKQPCRILEIACGLAHNAKFAAGLGHNVIATDFSHLIINESMKRFSDPLIRYYYMELETALESFKGFDVIMGFEIIEHFRNPLIPLLKIRKSLKEGGMFVFSVPEESGNFGIWCQHYSLWTYQKTLERLFKVGFKKVLFYNGITSNQNIMGVAYK